MERQRERRGARAQALVVPLIICVVGVIGIVVLFQLVPGFQSIELVLLVGVVFVAAGFTQGIVRGIASLISVYVATAIAAVFYRLAAPYTGILKMVLEVPFTGAFTTDVPIVNGTLAFSFGFLTVVAWCALEIVSRLAFPDTTIPQLGFLDKLGGVAVYFVVGVLVTSLLFNTLGYGRLRPGHDRALLRSAFGQVVYVHYLSQSFWFSRNPPPIYIYDLNLSRGR